MKKIALVIPVLNAKKWADAFVDSFKNQTLKPQKVVIIDSQSSDNSLNTFGKIATDIYSIKKEEFNHGLTRNFILQKLTNFDIVVFMTQDAILASPYSLENLTKHFEDESVGAVYGRQLPRKNAHPIEAHARIFNYPDKSQIKTKEDIKTLGIKTVFGSNSFAGYNIKHLIEVGGFPKTILSEDTYAFAKLILSGYKIIYDKDATVYHSHYLSIREEFKRYFDTGVFHAKNPWIMDIFGKAQDEGKKFVKSELSYLWNTQKTLIPQALLRTISKYLAFKIGTKEAYLPIFIKKKLSMHKNFWQS